MHSNQCFGLHLASQKFGGPSKYVCWDTSWKCRPLVLLMWTQFFGQDLDHLKRSQSLVTCPILFLAYSFISVKLVMSLVWWSISSVGIRPHFCFGKKTGKWTAKLMLSHTDLLWFCPLLWQLVALLFLLLSLGIPLKSKINKDLNLDVDTAPV